MKIFRSPLWKALGLTVALSLALTLFLYTAAPLAEAPIGQAILFLGVALLQVTATCLYARIPFEKRRSLWLSAAVALPVHLILSIASVLVYADRLTSNWPGSDYFLTWLLFLLLSLSVWCISVCTVTLLRHLRLSAHGREERRRIQKASSGLRPVISAVSPARARLIAVLKGASWTLGLYVLTGLLLELLTALSIADTVLSFVAFPSLWCILAVVYGLTCQPNRGFFTLSVSLTHILLCAVIMVFLIPSNVSVHPGYALLYLDSVLTSPMDHPEPLLLIAEFLLVWAIVIAHSVRRPKK